MTEPQVPTPEFYAREAKYMEALRRHSDDFDELLQFVPDDREDIREAMRGVYHVEPDKLLDREKLAKLKQKNEALFKEVSTFYKSFLEQMIGLK